MHYFAENLRFLRKRQQLNQDELAQAVGLNRGNVASYEKGTAEPKIDNIIKFAQFFDIKVRDLLTLHLAQLSPEELATVRTYASNLPVGGTILIEEEMLQHFVQQYDSSVEALNGFNQFHRFKVAQIGSPSPETQKMVLDYEELLHFTWDLLRQHKELLLSIRSRQTGEAQAN